MFDALCAGLGDYTTDERGDVGSWIRMACIAGLTVFAEVLPRACGDAGALAGYLPPERYHLAVAGVLKQGVERLDNVRACAGTHVRRLMDIEPLGDAWRLEKERLLRELFLRWIVLPPRSYRGVHLSASDTENVRWSDGDWLYPRAVRLLEIKRYRTAVLDGIVISVASKTDHTVRC